MAINRKYSDFIKESYYRKSKVPQKVSDFIMEHRFTRDKMTVLRDEFTDDVLLLSEFYRTNFSDLCKKHNLTQSDLDLDYNNMQKLLDRKGWDFESIKNLFSKEVDKLCGDDIFGVIHKSPMDVTNGYIDYYLYRTVDKLGLDKNKVRLGGNGWVDSLYMDEELPIRYKYGYHHTQYGHLMLKQANSSVDEFVLKVTKFLVSMMKEDWLDDVINSVIRSKYENQNYTDISNIVRNSNVRDFDKYHILEEDRIIFFIREAVEDLNELLSELNGGNKITNEDFGSELSNLLYGFGKDIESTGNELILYGDFEKNFDHHY